MEIKRTKATDIAEICTLLDGKVDFQTISFNQVLTTDHGKSINDLLFVSKQYGIWFYTSRSAFESMFADYVKRSCQRMLFVRVQKMYMKFLINSEYENRY